MLSEVTPASYSYTIVPHQWFKKDQHQISQGKKEWLIIGCLPKRAAWLWSLALVRQMLTSLKRYRLCQPLVASLLVIWWARLNVPCVCPEEKCSFNIYFTQTSFNSEENTVFGKLSRKKPCFNKLTRWSLKQDWAWRKEPSRKYRDRPRVRVNTPGFHQVLTVWIRYKGHANTNIVAMSEIIAWVR